MSSLYGYATGYQPTRKPKPRVTQPTNPGWGNAGTDWRAAVDQPINQPYTDPQFNPNPPETGTGGLTGAIAGAYAPPGGRQSISFGGEPAYRGILDRYTNDWRARINSSIAAMGAQRMAGARAAINRLGVRDPTTMLGKVGQYGLTLADLQAAADNPYSELNAIGKQATEQRGAMIADRAARGGIRSGGSSRGVRMIEDNRARNEALASQEALQALAQGQWQEQEYTRNAWDDFNQRSFELEQQLAQQYQPTTAIWDAANGGYRAGNAIYDQNGNLVRYV